MVLLHSKKGFLLLLILLILFGISVWAVQTQRLELRKKAAIPETTLCWDRVYEAESGPAWPDSCRGNISSDSACLQVLTPLTENELAQYQAWVLNGKPPISGCFSPTPSCMPLPSCVNENPPCSIPNFDNYCPWPTPTPASCTGQPDGTACDASDCPVCNPGQPCPLMPCYLQKGLCQEGHCVVITPTPPPGCYYQQVQCIQAPCDPILICTTPSCPSPPPCAGPLVVGDPRPDGCPGYWCPVTPTPTSRRRVSWVTPFVSLVADQLKITAGDKTFYGIPDPNTTMSIHSDPPDDGSDPTYTTLEVMWTEQGVQMRFYMYLHRDSQKWWASEIRTYDGQVQNPNWIYYTDSPYFKTKLGQAFHKSDSLTIKSTSNNTPKGTTTFSGLTIRTFFPQGVTPTPTISPTPTFTPTPTPPRNVSSIELRIKFSGVTDGAAEGAGVTARFVRSNINVVTPPIRFTHAGNGVYKATVGLTGFTLPAGPGYTIILKGEKHVARKFCKQTGQTAPCQGNESMTISSGPSSPVFDFTGLTLDPGDLPPQDYKADSADFDIIKTLLSKPCSILTDQDKKTADLDYNGCIDIGDVFLMRKTLETRYDEN